MKLLCVGGGSGGHVTPVLAVINEIAKTQPDVSVVFVTDKAFLKQTEGLIKNASVPVVVKTVSAGKFRRYMDIALWKQVLRPDIGGRNMVDMFKVAGGVAQSIRLLRKFKPDVVFAKGGYVSLPVGYGAHFLKIPLVIHDSDVRPGLTNRVLSRWAQAIATGTPVKNYRYNAELTQYTGVPVGREFHPLNSDEQKRAKLALGHNPERLLVAVTGGGLGAKEINGAMVSIGQKIIDAGYSVHHVTGKVAYESISKLLPQEKEFYKAVPFVYEGLATVYGAADIVIARASATTLQELSAMSKPSIVAPNSSLGDQIENAEAYATDGAVLVVRDEQLFESPTILLDMLNGLRDDVKRREELSQAIGKYAMPEAAKNVAKLILKVAK